MAGVWLGVEAITGGWGVLSAMVTEALDGAGITPEEITQHERVGEGARYALPADRLALVVDVAEHLDRLAARHGKWHPGEAVRLCAAVDVGDSPNRLERLLGTPVVARCAVTSGLVLSDAAHQALGGHGDFVAVDGVWVRVPGVDVRTLADDVTDDEPVARTMNVVNTITGNAENVIQAGIVRGGVHFGERR